MTSLSAEKCCYLVRHLPCAYAAAFHQFLIYSTFIVVHCVGAEGEKMMLSLPVT